jgi:hypothetical protein
MPKTLKGSDSLIAVDDQEPARFLRQPDDHDGNLLPSFGERRQQAAFTVRPPHSKPLMA